MILAFSAYLAPFLGKSTILVPSLWCPGLKIPNFVVSVIVHPNHQCEQTPSWSRSDRTAGNRTTLFESRLRFGLWLGDLCIFYADGIPQISDRHSILLYLWSGCWCSENHQQGTLIKAIETMNTGVGHTVQRCDWGEHWGKMNIVVGDRFLHFMHFLVLRGVDKGCRGMAQGIARGGEGW